MEELGATVAREVAEVAQADRDRHAVGLPGGIDIVDYRATVRISLWVSNLREPLVALFQLKDTAAVQLQDAILRAVGTNASHTDVFPLVQELRVLRQQP